MLVRHHCHALPCLPLVASRAAPQQRYWRRQPLRPVQRPWPRSWPRVCVCASCVRFFSFSGSAGAAPFRCCEWVNEGLQGCQRVGNHLVRGPASPLALLATEVRALALGAQEHGPVLAARETLGRRATHAGLRLRPVPWPSLLCCVCACARVCVGTRIIGGRERAAMICGVAKPEKSGQNRARGLF